MNASVTMEDRWKLWQECLAGEDTNSIFNQITIMTWDAAIFRLITEGRRLEIEKHSNQPKINSYLHNFIDRTFFQSQVSCIRRLIEPSKKSKLRGSMGVFSLSALLKDIASVRPQLSRKTYFILRKLPYDYQEIIEREKAFTAEQAKKGVVAYFVPREFNWKNSVDAHTLFDKLSVNSQRSPDDVIHERIFTKLKEKLRSFEILTKYVDKYIAHAATPNSRRGDNVDDETITWKHLWDAHQSLYEIAEFLALILSGVEYMPLVWKSPFIFEHWDTPLISVNEISQIELAWDKFQKETEDWMLNGTNRMWTYINR